MFHHDISTGYTVKLYFLTMLINVKLFEEKKKKKKRNSPVGHFAFTVARVGFVELILFIYTRHVMNEHFV